MPSNVRFMRKGTTKIFFVPTIASATLVPTAVEVNAGTRIDTDLAEINGLSWSNNPIPTPDMASTFVSNIPGEDTADDTNMSFYERSTTNTIKAALAKGTSGYIVAFYAGTAGATPAAADKCDVWPVTVASNARGYSAGNEAAMFTVVFAATATPGEEKTLT